MRANLAFSLGAAAVSLLISTASAVKGRWAVAIVFGLLVGGFLLRALEGRRTGSREPAQGPVKIAPPSDEERRAARPPAAPEHGERRIKAARFKRR